MKSLIHCVAIVVIVAFSFVISSQMGMSETIIKFGDPGHSATGDWFSNGTNLSEHYQYPPDGEQTSTWAFTGLANGTYYVATDWTYDPNRTTMAQFDLNGASTVIIDQQSVSRDFYEFVGSTPVGWKNLGTVNVTDGNLTVSLSDLTDTDGIDDNATFTNFLMADAIRIDTVPGVTTIPGLFQGTVVDDGDPGHLYTVDTPTSAWFGLGSSGFNGDGGYDIEDNINFVITHTGKLHSEWTVDGLIPGLPTELSVTWVPEPNRATNAPYLISGIEGGDQTILVNQELAPNGDAYEYDSRGRLYAFQSLGTFIPVGTSLTIQLTNDADEFVIADAIRAHQVPEPGSVGILLFALIPVACLFRRLRSQSMIQSS